jgi:hypothetical protein
MVTNAGPLGMQWLYRSMRKIWLENKIPGDRYKGIIAPIYKKGDGKICNNYKEITLLSKTFKIYERILANKLTKETEKNWRKNSTLLEEEEQQQT